jgi:acetyl esterase/lipase
VTATGAAVQAPGRAEPFHPDLRRVARFLPRGVGGPRWLRVVRRLEPLAERRARNADATVTRVGGASVRLHRPSAGAAGPHPALLWIHGGGFVIGTASQDDELCRGLARDLGIVVAAVDYRRAPEHPFPVPLHDCHDALAWLAAQPDVDATHVAVGGASAGGGLAAALALLARERGEVALAFQLLVYPMLDDRTTLRTDVDERHVRMWNGASNRFGWRSYLGADPGGPGVDPLAAPARHPDLRGLPPAWIGVGSLDLFLAEDRAYAARLRDAGVPCELDVVPGTFHGFDAIRPGVGVSRSFRATQAQALAGALGS